MASNRYPSAARALPAPAPDYPRPAPRVPANDNIPRRAPIPANDNVPRPFEPLRAPARRLFPRMAGRAIGRIIPILGLALLAYDLWSLWRWLQEGQGSNHASSGDCGADPNNGKPHAFAWREGFGCYSQIPHPFNEGPYDTIPPYSRFYPVLVYSAMLYGPPIYNEWKDIKWWYYPNGFNGVNPLEPAPDVSVPFPAQQPDPWYIPWFDPFVPPLLPQPRPDPGPVWGKPNPPNRPETSEKGSYVPGSTGTRPDIAPLPGRPPAGTKERKVQGQRGSWFRKYGGKLLSAASEAGDLLDVLHDALPEELQVDGTMKDKLQAVYQHADKVDMEKAVRGIWENHQEDRIWGHGFQKTQELFEAYGIDLGSLRL